MSEQSKHYSLKIDGVEHTVHRSIVTGHELLQLAGKTTENFEVAFRIPGQPEQRIGPDEEFDLNAPGVEHLVTIDKRPHYSIYIDETMYRVSEPLIDGRQILELAGKSLEDHFVVQRIPHADDVVIQLDQCVDLAAPGTEKFAVVRKPVEPLWIIIDEVRYSPTKHAMTGQELRALPNPPVPPTRDLWLDVPGKDDLKIAPTQTVELKSGMVFYTAPATINPGECYATA